ncbi:MAG: methionine synthase [Candidatus Dormibacteria bacterium]
MGRTTSDTGSAYLEALRERVLVFDGAMGTSVQSLEPNSHQFGGTSLDGWIDGLVLHSPDIVREIHRTMLSAGADAVETCTFQATRLRLEEWGQADRTLELNRRGAEIAREACDTVSTAEQPRFVAGSIGPTGNLPASSDPSLGRIRFPALVDAFAEQCQGLIEGGSDVLVIETQQDLLETKAAIFGARRAIDITGRWVPIQAQVSLDVSGRMLLGTEIGAVTATLDGLRVDIIGLNCSTGPEHMRDAIRYLGENSPVPIACIPNAGLPLNVGGRAHFPLEPNPMADQLLEFVAEFGVGIVGGCCGTTPAHITALRERIGIRAPLPRRPDLRPRLASSMRAVDLEQQPAPLLIGERVNSQGSRRIKEFLLNDDYQGILGVGRHQVEGGAHALDVCVALTERVDEAEQMHHVVKTLQMSVDTPLVFDSTDADVVREALESYPGRGIVNSVNLENGRTRCEAVLPLVRDHGQTVIALTIDEAGMAKTRERKLEIARRIVAIADEFGVRPEQILFDALTFTLATGDKEWIDSAVETIEGIRLIKQELPGVHTCLGVSNVSFGLKPHARAVINSVFLHHCVEAGLDTAIINPVHVAPYAEIPQAERDLTEDLIFNRGENALTALIEHFEGRTGEIGVAQREDPLAGLDPAQRIHQQILLRKKDGIEEQIDLVLLERTPVAVLNEVLLPAMKDVGDRFGAGELILPYVLQSAEVMKRAVAHVEQFLEKKDGQTKGRVVLATVFGDVHDIGKNLVNTILTNNGYTVHDLGKQVPLTTIIEKAIEVEADVIGLSALLVSTSKQMPLMLQELERRRLRYPVIIGGAAINRGFGRRILFIDAENPYDPGVFYCKDAFEGLDTCDQLVDPQRRNPLVERIRSEGRLHQEREQEKAAASAAATSGGDAVSPPARSDTRTDVSIPQPPFWGAQVVSGISPQAVYSHIDRNSLFKMSWQFKGVHDKTRWEELVATELEPRLERSMREAQRDRWLDLQAVYGYWPALAEGNDIVVFNPEDHDREIGRFRFPRQTEQNRLCLADYIRPRTEVAAGERDVIALQVVTAGPHASELSNRLQREGAYDDMLRVHGFATQMAEATAEYIHTHIRRELKLGPDQGRRYSWGYPACPDLEDHETFFQIVPADRIGVELTEGFQLVPEQSTAAITLHHPEARYFAVYSGRFDEMMAELRGAPEPEPVG